MFPVHTQQKLRYLEDSHPEIIKGHSAISVMVHPPESDLNQVLDTLITIPLILSSPLSAK